MGTKNSEWEVRGTISPDLIDCAALWECVDISERTVNIPDKTFTYCGVGKNARLLSVDPGQRVPGTGTLIGPDEELLDVVEEFEFTDCPAWFQLVHCESGEIRHYTGVYFGNRSSQNPITAQGPNSTSTPNIDTVSFQFDRIVRIRGAKSVPLGQFVSEEGYNVNAPVFGVVNGTNTDFRLQYVPLTGYPVIVYQDGVVVDPDDYTLSGRNLSFDTAPECGVEVTVDYYDERYAVYGLCPVAVMFCSDNCVGTSNCVKCGDVYAIYESSVAADPDVCGNISGNVMAVGYWDYARGDLSLNSVTLATNVINPVDAVCDASGEIVVIAENGVFEGCESGFSSVNATNFPAGANARRITYDRESKEIYILFNNSGVLRRNKLGIWSVALVNNSLTNELQNDIASYSDTIVTVGNSNTVQISENASLTWALQDGPDIATSDLTAVAVGPTNDPSNDDVLIGVLGSNASTGQTSFYVTADHSVNWSSARKSWDFIPVNQPQLEMFEDWLVYAQLDDETWRNANRGCDKCGAWEKLWDSGYLCSRLAVCYDDPNRIVVYARPDEAAVPDNGIMSGQLGQVGTFDVLDNDYTETCEAGLDTSTLTVVNHWFAGTNTQTSPTGGTVNITVTGVTPDEMVQIDVTNPVANGETVYVQYTVQTQCGNTLTGLLSVDFLA